MRPQKYWLPVRSILWERFSASVIPFGILSSLLFLALSSAQAAPFSFSVGESLAVSADQGIRYPSENRFEAVGNVVINQLQETIYGEKASLQMASGEMVVEGNVRYIGPEMTLYAQRLDYNINSGQLSVTNGRLVNDQYGVVGEQMSRVSPSVVEAVNAEYTTCKDCPESWSIYGKRVRILLGQYIHVQNALVKSNGVIILYLPYIVLPIKRHRQSGLLFPEFVLNMSQGLYYRQPVFWAIDAHRDATFMPSLLGEKGYGHELEYRQIFGESRWMQISNLATMDRYYLLPERERRPESDREQLSGTSMLRYMGNYEHHYQYKNQFHHHLYLTHARETDMAGDYQNYADRYVFGSEMPNSGFLEYRRTNWSVSAAGYYNRNLLTADPRRFDEDYVQVMPNVSIGTTPLVLWDSRRPLLPRRMMLGVHNDFHSFRQQHSRATSGDEPIRNSYRLQVDPYLKINWGSLGPLNVESTLKSENLFYRFPYERKQPWFTKNGRIIQSRISWEVEKFFGLAYQQQVPMSAVQNLNQVGSSGNGRSDEEGTPDAQAIGPMVGKVPSFDEFYTSDQLTLKKNSYKHSIFFALNHYYLENQVYKGNERFAEQIRSSSGLFDSRDAPRELEYEIGSNAYRKSIPQLNTLELEVLNSLFKKTPTRDLEVVPVTGTIRDSFVLAKVAYFNVSQGIQLSSGESQMVDQLTRLKMDTGFNWGRWSIRYVDYYFYQNQKHDFSLALKRATDWGSFSLAGEYERVNSNPSKTLALAMTVLPTDWLEFRTKYAYDFLLKHYASESYDLVYKPSNNCWQMGLQYSDKPGPVKERALMFNFFVNFGDGIYTSLLDPQAVAGSTY